MAMWIVMVMAMVLGWVSVPVGVSVRVLVLVRCWTMWQSLSALWMPSTYVLAELFVDSLPCDSVVFLATW